MFRVHLDNAANLLTITFGGAIGVEEAERCASEVQRRVSNLRMEFRLLTDLSRLESMDLACVPQIERVMDLCDQAGVKLVVRVIPDHHKDIGFNIMSLFHYRRGVRIVTCDTLEEAQKALAQ